MQFGIFDQNDHGPYSLSEQYEHRLQLIEFYDRAGFRTYHMSEHHSTPLNLTPSPSVFLAAVAQRTKRLRLGALVYVLPAHHPLRLAEEICMLDYLSQGRVEVGIGRGASPHELQYFGVDPDQAQAMYVEAYTVIMQALTQTEVNFGGKHYHFENVPIDMKPAQAAARNQPLRRRGRHRSRSDGTRSPCLAGVLYELHETLEEARHAAALCPNTRRFRHGRAERRRDRGGTGHHP